MKQRLFLITALLAVAVAGVFLWRQQSIEQPLDKVGSVRLAAALSLPAAPLWIAEERGLFAKAGVDAVLKQCATGKACAESMLNNETDLATAAEFKAAHLALTDKSLRILSTTAFMHTTKVLSLQNKGITGPVELKGKRVGLRRGTNSDYFLARLLTLSGMGREDIVWVDLKPPEMAAALAEGKVDAVIVWSPYTRQIKAKLGGRISEFDGQPGQDYYYVVLGRHEWLAANGTIAARVMLALKWAEAWMAAHPEQTQALLAAKYGLPTADLEEDLRNSRFDISLPQPLLTAMEAEFRWLAAQGVAGTPPTNSLELIAFAPLSAAAPEAVTMIRGTVHPYWILDKQTAQPLWGSKVTSKQYHTVPGYSTIPPGT